MKPQNPKRENLVLLSLTLVIASIIFIFALFCAGVAQADWQGCPVCERDGVSDYGVPDDPGWTPEEWQKCADGCPGDENDTIFYSDAGLPTSTGDPNELLHDEIFWFHHVGDGNRYQVLWTNNSGKIHVHGYCTFIGVDIGGICDTSIIVMRGNNKGRLAEKGWDHYKDPTGPNHHTCEYFPSNKYMTIDSGETITMYSYSSPLGGKNFAHGFSLIFSYPE